MNKCANKYSPSKTRNSELDNELSDELKCAGKSRKQADNFR